VFDLIVRRARELCNTPNAGLFELMGTRPSPIISLAKRHMPRPPQGSLRAAVSDGADARSITCRAILDRQIIHVRDLATAPGVSAAVRNLGHKSQIAVPLLRDGAAIGAMALASLETGGFSDSQVGLLQPSPSKRSRQSPAPRPIANCKPHRRADPLGRELQALEKCCAR